MENIEEMRRLSEVCKILGVSRRKLQEYDRIDLINPSFKSEKNYWYYDVQAIQKLKIILIFSEAGYERKKIKSILNSTQTLDKEYDTLIEELKRKRKEITGWINYVIMWKSFSKMSESLEKIADVFIDNMNTDFTFIDSIKTVIDLYSEDEEELFSADVETTIPIVFKFIEIGTHYGEQISSEEVQNEVLDFYNMVIPYLKDNIEEEVWQDILKNPSEYFEIMDCLSSEIIEGIKQWTFINSKYIKIILPYITKAIHYFCENNPMYLNFDDKCGANY